LNRTRSTDMHTGYIHTFNSRLQTINYFLKLVQTQTDTEKSKHITHTHTHKLKKLLKTKGVNYIVYSIILQGFVKIACAVIAQSRS